MFNSITWHDFLLGAALVIGAYYAITVLLLYSREIMDFLKNGIRKSPTAQPSPLPSRRNSVMGEARTNDLALIHERTAQLSSEELIVDQQDDAPEFLDAAGTAQLDALDVIAEELMGEVTSVVQLALDCESDKDETASLINALLVRYPRIRESVLKAPLNQSIADEMNSRLPFTVEPKDINSWWDE